MTNVTTAAVDLDQCAQEPIRVPGAIQPHGALLVLDAEGQRILHASRNAESLLGPMIREHRLDQWLESGARDVATWLASGDPTLLRTVKSQGRPLQLLGHKTSQGVVLEFEEAPAHEGESLEAFYPRIGKFTESIQAMPQLVDVCEAAASEFRRITGFNRVLIYRFDADWNGVVLAEDGDSVLPSYLGLHFPASDIPAQARELYRLNRLRLIPNATYTPVAIDPPTSPVDHAPLDLSFAALRSVSPVHLEYMRNMGTLASMSISILVDGALWGLVSCHNAAPRRVSAQVRGACDLLGKVLSLQIGAHERGAYAARRIEMKGIEGELLARMGAAPSLQQGLTENGSLWLKFAGAGGAAFLYDDEAYVTGDTPPLAQLRELAAQLHERKVFDGYATDAVPREWPHLSNHAEIASGLLAISVSQLHPNYMFWFRPEVVRTVTWSGDPRKAVAPSTGRLHPRLSFESWKDVVRERSLAWSRAEIDGAADFRAGMINLVLRRAEERAELTQQLQRSNHELESFSYSVSHDLRAPFRHIVGYTQLLRDSEQSLSERSQHYLDSINEAAGTAGQLVDDLLSFSHLGRTALAQAPIDMNKLLKEVMQTLKPDTADRDVEWRIGELPPAHGDASLVRQALINLLDNALKYTRGRKPAVIEVSGETQADACVYAVRDNGVGFDMAYVGKLFGVFQRLHRMEDFEGTGIGLALTKRIIERHGGAITAEAKPGRGACFTFTIPKSPTGVHDG